MKKFSQFFIFACLLSTFLMSCADNSVDPSDFRAAELNLPEVPLDYVGEDFPDHFSSISFFDNTPQDNITTNDGATLGRVLFYDKKLSINNATSCASCHKQELAFSDDTAFSPGFEGKLSSRNSMAIVNPRFSTTLMWDGANMTLEEQALTPIQHQSEMGLEDLDDLVTKLQAIDYYPPLFEKAFGTSEITVELVAKGLAQFMRSLQCSQSKYDQGVNSDFENFTSLQKMGKDLFESPANGCSNCHRSINFYYGSESNIGLTMDYTDEGKGNGQFRIPSVRNVALTGPYMHDGSLETLEDVVDHYNDGVQPHPFLDWRLKDNNGEPKKLNLSDLEKKALVEFLKTLTDENFISDEKWSDPFKS